MSSLPVERKVDYSFGPGISEHLVEAPQNIFVQRIHPDSASLDRMSFTSRAPSSGLLCHPRAYLEFELLVDVDAPVTAYSQSFCGFGPVYDGGGDVAEA